MESPTVAELVEAHRHHWATSAVEDEVFGKTDAASVGSWYERLCASTLDSTIRRGLFFAASAKCALGVELEDGRQVVVKAYQRAWSLDILSAMSAAQARLASAGFACPSPVGVPFIFEGVTASVEHELPDPGMRTFEREEMAISAGALSEAHSLLANEDAQPWVGRHALDRPKGALYPAPHSPLFDFSLNAEAAAWIDELAVAALKAMAEDVSPPQIVHGDWSARNIRIAGGRLVASYDWDSLAAFPESRGVGIAAAIWRLTGEAGEPSAPDAQETEHYIDAYVGAAGGARGRTWHIAAMGSALSTLAYMARCEHSLEARDATQQHRRARNTLEADRQGFLTAIGGT
ncbi:MAG TPA: phosphotransferase [Acidimicrobiales bacterium]|jgi:hypothetical protein|nr:phosphotransferase [Acidimicrobiales bacterium]